MTPRIGSLFSGYGGLDMGVQAVIGGTVAWHVEFDDAPSRILAHHWPDIPNYGDITKIDWAKVEPVDVLTGGYPCQPFSTIGKRKGETDDRHLWPHFAAAIRALRPRLAILENVAGHLSLGFDRVLADLAEIGWDAEWVCLPASAAGAPHRRSRVFIAAHPKDEPWRFRDGDDLQARWAARQPESGTGTSAATHAHNFRNDWNWATRDGRNESEDVRIPDAVWGATLAGIRQWETITGRHAPWPGHSAGGVTTEFSEWMMGLPKGHVTDPAIGLTREQQAHAIGNGVVPQQAALALSILTKRMEVNLALV